MVLDWRSPGRHRGDHRHQGVRLPRGHAQRQHRARLRQLRQGRQHGGRPAPQDGAGRPEPRLLAQLRVVQPGCRGGTLFFSFSFSPFHLRRHQPGLTHHQNSSRTHKPPARPRRRRPCRAPLAEATTETARRARPRRTAPAAVAAAEAERAPRRRARRSPPRPPRLLLLLRLLARTVRRTGGRRRK